MRDSRVIVGALTMLVAGAFASPARGQTASDTTTPGVRPRTPPSSPQRSVRLAFLDSLHEPESVLLDQQQDVYFVSNIQGPSLSKDGNGFISRVARDGGKRDLHWIESGRGGARLDAPKGMAIVGDTLWVSDVTVMRAFNRRTGAPITSVDLAGQGASFLNDVAVGPDGAIYVTDTELEARLDGTMHHPRADRIFRIAGRTPSIALQTDRLHRPNGIAWDRRGSRFVLVPFDGDTLMTWKPGASAIEPLVAGPGQYDGVAITDDGRLFVSSKATSAVHELRDGKLVKVIEHLDDPADFDVDTAHERIGIPMTAANRVDWLRIPR